MNQKTMMAKLLRALAVGIEGIGEKELEQLLTGKGKLVFVLPEKQKDVPPELSVDHDAIMDQLNNCSDRDAARTVLSGIASKDQLASFAKRQKLYVAKHDRREDIENKIIEFIIGAKLRTEAIQSLNMKGGGS